MTINFEIYKNSVWQNINNHIDGCDPVPYISRNRDYSFISEPHKMEISFLCPYTPAVDDIIKIEIDSTLIYMAYVKIITPNYEKRVYEVTTQNQLSLLNNYKVTDENNTLFNALSQNSGDLYKYNPSDIYGCPNVNVLWLLKCMFSIAGYTLITTAVDNLEFAYTYVSVPYCKLAMDENMVYCVGINAAGHKSVIMKDHRDEVATFFKLSQDIISVLGLSVITVDINTYALIKSADTAYVIPENDKWEYKRETINVDAKNAQVIINVTSTGDGTDSGVSGLRGEYKNGLSSLSSSRFGPPDEGDLNDGFYIPPSIDKIPEDVNWPSNLVIVPYENHSSTWQPDIIIKYARLDKSTLNFHYNLRQNMIDITRKDYIKETFECPINLNRKNVIKNFINIKTRRSEIEQEAVI